jgi:hypothetical protein
MNSMRDTIRTSRSANLFRLENMREFGFVLPKSYFGRIIFLSEIEPYGLDRYLSQTCFARFSDPTLQGHSGGPSRGLRQKSAFARPVNCNGRRAAIPEECEIFQETQIARLQIPLHPGAC